MIAHLYIPAAQTHNLNFHRLAVVSRYRDPQLQVGENLNYLIYRFKGYYTILIGIYA